MKNNLNEINTKILELEKLIKINNKKIIKIPECCYEFSSYLGLFFGGLTFFFFLFYIDIINFEISLIELILTVIMIYPCSVIISIPIIILLEILNYFFNKINKILFKDEYFLKAKFLFFYHSTNKIENQKKIDENVAYLESIKLLEKEKLELITFLENEILAKISIHLKKLSVLYKSISDTFKNENKVIAKYNLLNINILNSLLDEINKFEKIVADNNFSLSQYKTEFINGEKVLIHYDLKEIKLIKNEIERKLNNKSNYLTQLDIKLIKKIFKSNFDKVNDCINYYRDESRGHLRHLIYNFLENYVDIKIDNEDYKTIVLFYKKKFEELEIDVEYYRKKSTYSPRTILTNKNPIDNELEKLLKANKPIYEKEKSEEENTKQKFKENIDKKSPIEDLINKLNTDIPKVKNLPYNRNHLELEEVLTNIETIFNNELDLSEDEKNALKSKYIKEWDNYYSKMKDANTTNNEKKYLEAVKNELDNILNYKTRIHEKDLKIIGLKGELFVIKVLKEVLTKANLAHLADKIMHTSVEKAEMNLGYDIQAFDSFGKEIYVEVKTTTEANANASFILTKNEMKAIQEVNRYFIYRVYNFDLESEKGAIKIIDCHNDLLNKYNIKESKFLLRYE
jgi:hypothetical protein